MSGAHGEWGTVTPAQSYLHFSLRPLITYILPCCARHCSPLTSRSNKGPMMTCKPASPGSSLKWVSARCWSARRAVRNLSVALAATTCVKGGEGRDIFLRVQLHNTGARADKESQKEAQGAISVASTLAKGERQVSPSGQAALLCLSLNQPLTASLCGSHTSEPLCIISSVHPLCQHTRLVKCTFYSKKSHVFDPESAMPWYLIDDNGLQGDVLHSHPSYTTTGYLHRTYAHRHILLPACPGFLLPD